MAIAFALVRGVRRACVWLRSWHPAFSHWKFRVCISLRWATKCMNVTSGTWKIILAPYPTRSVGLQGSSDHGLQRLAVPPPKFAAARRGDRRWYRTALCNVSISIWRLVVRRMIRYGLATSLPADAFSPVLPGGLFAVAGKIPRETDWSVTGVLKIIKKAVHLAQFYVDLQRLGAPGSRLCNQTRRLVACRNCAEICDTCVQNLQLTLHRLWGGNATIHWLPHRGIPNLCAGPKASWITLCLFLSSRTGFFPCCRTTSSGALYRIAGRSHWQTAVECRRYWTSPRATKKASRTIARSPSGRHSTPSRRSARQCFVRVWTVPCSLWHKKCASARIASRSWESTSPLAAEASAAECEKSSQVSFTGSSLNISTLEFSSGPATWNYVGSSRPRQCASCFPFCSLCWF